MEEIYKNIKHYNIKITIFSVVMLNLICILIVAFANWINIPEIRLFGAIFFLCSLLILSEPKRLGADEKTFKIEDLEILKQDNDFFEFKPFLLNVIGDKVEFTYGDFKKAFEDFKKSKLPDSQKIKNFLKEIKQDMQ